MAAGLSILGQIGEQLDLPIAPSLLEELTVLARAQRRVLRAAHRQLEETRSSLCLAR